VNINKVLYIGGAGRSGSTLLDMIIGNTQDAVSVGEVKHFFEYFSNGSIRCGCGLLLPDCSFWKGIVQAAGFSREEVALASELNKFNRTRNFWKFGRQLRSDPALDTLCSYFSRLYSAILEMSGKVLLIDNSKSPSHLLLLRQVARIEVHLLHLLRHPVAVGYAWNERTKNDPAVEGTTMQKRGILPSVFRWALENELIAQQKNWVAGYFRLRYEDFVGAPKIKLVEALVDLGLKDISQQVDKVLRSPSIDRTHSIRGNPVRFHEGKLKIMDDSKWRTRIPAWKKVTLVFLIYPWMRKFGY
jgi:hypothetical protein